MESRPTTMTIISTSSRVPRKLAIAVSFVASAMLLIELLVTRFFSVLFLYHYSFFAVSLVMSGLAFGGLIAARWNVRDLDETSFFSRLSVLGFFFSIATAAAMMALVI